MYNDPSTRQGECIGLLRLPDELITAIARVPALDQVSLAFLTRTCRRLRDLVRDVAFNRIQLNSHVQSQALIRVLESDGDASTKGHAIKEVTFRYAHELCPESDLMRVLTHTPHLQFLSISVKCYRAGGGFNKELRYFSSLFSTGIPSAGKLHSKYKNTVTGSG